jgi:hypothetical protein
MTLACWSRLHCPNLTLEIACVGEYADGVSWAGFKKGLRALTHPPSRRNMTAEDREYWRRYGDRYVWGFPWFFQALEPPPRKPREQAPSDIDAPADDT